jgi:hypothetical protein
MKRCRTSGEGQGPISCCRQIYVEIYQKKTPIVVFGKGNYNSELDDVDKECSMFNGKTL